MSVHECVVLVFGYKGLALGIGQDRIGMIPICI